MRDLTQIRLQAVAFGVATVLHFGASANAQVETIDPNPTMPRDVGGRLTYRSHSGGGRLGRAAKGEENPAETLLKSIDGTNYGRSTGHSVFGVQPRTNTNAGRHLRRPDPSATMFFGDRGAYEDRVYAPAKGTYRTAVRQQTFYRGQPTAAGARTSPESGAKAAAKKRATMSGR